MARRIGNTQLDCLRSMVSHRSDGTWHEGCGWYWSTRSGTIRIMESLARRGLVSRSEKDHGVWGQVAVFTITEAGREAANGKA